MIFTKSNCHLDSVTREGQSKMALLGDDHVLGELLPGVYALELRYCRQGDHSSEGGSMAPYKLQVEAGHLYYIHSELSKDGVWRPALIDIACDNDYQKIANLNGHGCLSADDEDPEYIRKRVHVYFAGPRTPLEKKEYPVRNGTITLWR